jgi:hypothetical protein
MPRRSKVFGLDQETRDELNARLVASGFAGYEALAQWLEGRGYKLSKSALHRYGGDLQADFDSAMSDVRRTTDLARAYVAGDADEQASLVDATARIAQETLLRISIELRKAELEPEKVAAHMSKVARALADLGRVSIAQKKWAQELRRKTLEAAAQNVESEAKRQGASATTIDALRAAIMQEMGA